MTVAEIITAVNHCLEVGECIGCPIFDERFLQNYGAACCEARLLSEARAALEALQAENESLESRIFALKDTNKILTESQEIYWRERVKEFGQFLIDRAKKGNIKANDIPFLATEWCEKIRG